MFISAHLAVLASLISALAPSPADGAYLPSRRPEMQNVHRFAPGPPPPRFGGHYPVSGHNRAHVDKYHAHNRVPNSFFTRRPHRDSFPLRRRSSIYVTGEDGDTYLVSRSRTGERGHRDSDEQNAHSYAHGRRQSNQVIGRVDVVGFTPSSDSPQQLASLVVDSTPTDWTSGQNATKVFRVNASASNQTQFIMMVVEEPSDTTSPSKHVSLAMQVFDADSAEAVMYCATYDSDPTAASALIMAPCTVPSAASVIAPFSRLDNATDPSPSANPHRSQIFSYDPFTGQIQPLTSLASTDTSSHHDRCGFEERRDIVNSTTSSSATHSPTQSSAAPAPTSSQQARNVTLVYVPQDLEVPPSSRSLGTTNASQLHEDAVVTTTVTTTVVATVTASTFSSRSPTPAQAEASASTTRTASLVSAGSATRSTSASSTASSRSSVATQSLEIEIIGVPATTTASSSSVSSTTITHSSTSTALNAQAVASSIAHAATPILVGFSRRRVFGRT